MVDRSGVGGFQDVGIMVWHWSMVKMALLPRERVLGTIHTLLVLVRLHHPAVLASPSTSTR